MADNADWLAKRREDIIDPDRPIIDPHHHLWDFPGSRYMLDEVLADTGDGHNIRATVFVECTSMYRADGPEHLRPVGETEFINGIAAQSASGQYGETRIAAAIVGFADLALGDSVAETLESHVAHAPERFRGIRHASAYDDHPDIENAHTHPPKGLTDSAAFREGFARLAPMGLTFDAWLYHPQVPELTALARAFPDTTIIFDHFGGPLGVGPYKGKRAEIFEAWKPQVAELATCPNVVAKLGGINMTVNGFGWHKLETPPSSDDLVAATRDWYLHMIDIFGPSRCMFESNFPMDKVSGSYATHWNAFKKMAAPFSEAEKTDLFHDTAKRVYRLDV
ncbi:MAG: amidohydrolase family protein [Rhizobiales bacterium]|nr:amidohydrolase family protein [Hyphomicrobiales bacterium]